MLVAGGRSAGIGVLDDGNHRLVELLRQLPAGLEIDKVIEAEFFALELVSAGDAEAATVGIKSGALVWILAVAQSLGQRQVDAQGGGESGGVGRS